VRTPRIVATTDPPVPAHDDPDVTTLLIEIARLRGTSEAVQRVAHGMDDVPPQPGPG